MAFHNNKWTLKKQAHIRDHLSKVSDESLRALGVTRERLIEMELEFHGTIVVPGDPDYDKDRQGNPLYPAYPQIIVYCTVATDVIIAIGWALYFGWWVTCRSGGHSTAGYSVNSGMVIDTSQISYVSIDLTTKRAIVGAGTSFKTFNKFLNAYQLHTPGGGCGDVCVAGYMQGGGYGFTSREYGMNCDNVLEFKMVMANGHIAVANQSQNKELFWAVCGGTGDNFGVLVEVTYQLYDLYELYGWYIQWSLDDAPAALSALQQGYMQTGAPKQLGYQAMLASSRNTPSFVAVGMYHGTKSEGRAAINALLGVGKPLNLTEYWNTYEWLNTHLLDDNLTPPPPNDDLVEFKQCGYIAQQLTAAQWAPIVAYYRTAPNPFAMVGLEPYGGAISANLSGNNSFIHRKVDCDLFVDSFFNASGSPTTRQQAETFIEGMMATVSPYFNGEVYQNYPMRGLANYSTAYWGNAYSQLQKVKKQYDPNNFFRFEQSISLP